MLGVAETEAEMDGQAGEAAALAVGINEGAASRIGFHWCGHGNDGGDRAIECGVHGLSFFELGGVPTPHYTYECQNKGDKKWAICK